MLIISVMYIAIILVLHKVSQYYNKDKKELTKNIQKSKTIKKCYPKVSILSPKKATFGIIYTLEIMNHF